MKPVSKKALQVFKRWGKKGGKKRAQSLSALKRQSISRHAAQMRWSGRGKNKPFMQSVRLKEPLWEDPVYLEEVLLYGGLGEWRELRCIIADRPFGTEAVSLKKVLDATKIYGTTPLWNGILRHFKGDFS